MDMIEGAIIKATGIHWTAARCGRNYISYGWKAALLFYAVSYHLMYKADHWEDRKNLKIMYQKPDSLPSHSNWPHQADLKREKTDYWGQFECDGKESEY
jgi:hypothetical protein